jgi:hypothetical protein
MKFMVSIGINRVYDKKKFPIGNERYPFSRESYFKSKKIRLRFLQERTNRVSYPANLQN